MGDTPKCEALLTGQEQDECGLKGHFAMAGRRLCAQHLNMLKRGRTIRFPSKKEDGKDD